MQLLSQITLEILGFSVNYASFLNMIPYKWDRKQGLLRLSNSSFRVTCWKFQVYLLMFHQVFLSVRLWQSISGGQESFSFYCVQVTYFTGFLVVSTLQGFILKSKTELILFTNRLVLYSKELQSKVKYPMYNDNLTLQFFRVEDESIGEKN